MKQQLVFDVTDAETLAASDNVGAWVRAGDDGTQISSQNVNSQDWLNTASILYDEAGAAITDANPLAVSVKDGVNVEVDLDHADDSVRLGDGTDLTTTTTVGGDVGLDVNLINTEIAVTQGSDSPWTVDATDLDIRDLNSANDSVAAVQSGTWDIGTLTSITNDVNIADGGNSITVDSVDLDIRSLDHSSGGNNDSVRLGDGTDLITSTLSAGKQALDVYIAGNEAISINDAALADTAIATASNTLGADDTAEDVVASPLANRKYLFLMNNSNKTMYVGASGVSAATGFPMKPQVTLELRAGPSVDIEFVGPDAGQDLRTMELS